MRHLITTLLLSFISVSLFAQNALEKQRMVAILDLQNRNQEDDSRIFSAEQLANAAGFPFIITSDISVAIGYGFILSSSDFNSTTFTSGEVDTLKSYVSAGGILLTSNMKDYRMNDVFGVSNYTTVRNNYTLNWNVTSNDSSLLWFDQPREQEVILGNSSISEVIFTRQYTVTSGTALAYFNNDPTKPAVVVNKYGQGYAYTLGYSLRDISLRNMLNFDFSTERNFNNSFEPNADVHVLFLRAWFTKHGKGMVWKHTTPVNSFGVAIITHDVSSRAAMDNMELFSEWEKNAGIVADYNVATRYFADSLLSDFYAGNESKVNKVRDDGHRINSNSVGHFVDFHEFEMGPYGESVNTYFPFYDGNQTTGGYILPELQVSKSLIFTNHGVNTQTFRAGYLRFPKKLPNALDTLNYRYDCSLSTNDLGYSFPFPLKKDQRFSGQTTNVLEISTTFSDAISSDFNSNNYQDKISNWVTATYVYGDNHSPVSILIHPNKAWKLTALQSYINQLNLKFMKLNSAAYGDYWRMRENVSFSSQVNNDTLYITIPSSQLPLDPWMSFMVENSDQINEVIVKSSTGFNIDMAVERMSNVNRFIVYNEDYTVGETELNTKTDIGYTIYPNPTSGLFTVKSASQNSRTSMQVFDLTGKKVFETQFNNQAQINLDLQKGVYILRFTDYQLGSSSTQKIILN